MPHLKTVIGIGGKNTAFEIFYRKDNLGIDRCVLPYIFQFINGNRLKNPYKAVSKVNIIKSLNFLFRATLTHGFRSNAAIPVYERHANVRKICHCYLKYSSFFRLFLFPKKERTQDMKIINLNYFFRAH